MTQSGTASSGGAFNVNNQLSGSTVEPTNTCAQSTSIFCYDLAGDVTWDGANRYAYDAESRITSARTLAGLSVTYTYDAEGNRVRKDTSTTLSTGSAGNDPTEYISFNGEPIAEYDPNTGDWTDYIFANA